MDIKLNLKLILGNIWLCYCLCSISMDIKLILILFLIFDYNTALAVFQSILN